MRGLAVRIKTVMSASNLRVFQFSLLLAVLVAAVPLAG